MSRERADRSYRLEPLDTSGIFLGLGLVQCILLGGGIALAVIILSAGAPLPVAAVSVVVGAAGSFTRIGGYATWEWVPLLAGWTWTRLGRGRRWTAPLPLWTATEGPAPMPPCLDGLDIVGIDWHAGAVLSAVRDRHRHTLTAVVPASGPQFVVEPRGRTKSGCWPGGATCSASTPSNAGVVSHLSWSDLAQPSGMADHIAWLSSDERGTPNSTAAASYRELLEVGTASAINHRSRRHDHRRPRTSLPAPGRKGGVDEQLRRALVTSVEALLRGLRSADLAASGPLDPPGLQRLVRSRIDPVGEKPRPRRGRLVERLALVRSGTAGPLALDTDWRHLRVDGAFHRTWWVGTWPRLAVPPAWLEPFLSGGGVTRSMTVYFQPVSTHQSRRRIERDLVKLRIRRRHQRREGTAHRRPPPARHPSAPRPGRGARRRLPEMGYAGLVTVSARTLDDLDEHSEIIEQLARENGMDLRPRRPPRPRLGRRAPTRPRPSTLLAS